MIYLLCSKISSYQVGSLVGRLRQALRPKFQRQSPEIIALSILVQGYDVAERDTHPSQNLLPLEVDGEPSVPGLVLFERPEISHPVEHLAVDSHEDLAGAQQHTGGPALVSVQAYWKRLSPYKKAKVKLN